MIELLQWSTLAVCGLIALARVPSALRGENRTLFYIFALLTLAILLSIEAPYLAIDRLLGGINITNVILRFIIFAAIYFVGVRITKGFSADAAYRLLTGRVGMGILALVSALILVLFFMMDTSPSSVGLTGVNTASERNAVLVEYYGAAGRAYPAYVSLVLLPAMVRAVFSRLPLLVRIAAGLLAVGGAAVGLTLLFPLVPAEWSALMYLTNYTAILCYVVGLTLIWLARLHNNSKARKKRTSTAK